jgi:hypothetical protein
MTTPLSKPVARVVRTSGTAPALVVTLTEAGIAFRIKGTRTSYLLPYGVAYTRAATLEADRTLAAKRSGRRQRVSRGLLATEARHG